MSLPVDDDATGFPSLTEGKPLRFSELVGCDKLSISFPVDNFDSDLTSWSTRMVVASGSVNQSETRSAKVSLVPGQWAHVGLRYIPGNNRWFAKVEFNPARVIDPDGVTLCPLGDVYDLTADVVGEVVREGLVEPAVGSLGEMRVKRVDLARDFVVDRPGWFVDALRTVPRPWVRRTSVYSGANGAQTLMAGSNAGSCRLYDKHEQTGGVAPPGTLRWEVEAKAWAERFGGVETMADMQDLDRVADLAWNRWEWSGMGHKVMAKDEMIRLVESSGLSPAKQRSFVGWLVMQSVGTPQRLSNDTASEFRRIARDLGIALGVDDPAVPAFSARLDMESGTAVVCVA
jgi:hypothetical protein